MPSTNREQIDQLQQGIAALETQRAILGDVVVNASIQALQKQIDELTAAEEPASLQRKVATVLFTDIVDSTDLVQGLDPEDNLAIMDGALAQLAAVVSKHGGHVARFQGDGFKAIFGLDVTEETDPENAVRAGLAMLAEAAAYGREMEQKWRRSGFAIRIGIDTGLVIIGGATEAEDSVSGLTVNLAARLETAAAPGSLLISQHTYQQVRGIFDVMPRQPIEAKGFPEPVPVYEVQQAKPRAFRMNTRGVEGIATRTIGRDTELGALQAAFREAVDRSQTTLVTIAGDAGVGKSRLTYEFNNWLDLQPEEIWYFKGRATGRTQSVAQFLLRDLLAGRFQIKDSDPRTVVRQKFVAGISRFLPEDGEMKAHILGSWLGYDFGGSPHLARLKDEPQRIMNQATLFLAQFFSAVAAEDPVVILLDDIHWADSSSLDTMLDLIRRRPALPLLIVCLTRPVLLQDRPEWGAELPAYRRLDLAPLSAALTRDLVLEILRLVDPLPPILVDLISSRAEGNPYYAEELVKMLIDDGVILTGQTAWRVVPEQLVALNVPATLTGVLQARLDKLKPEAKHAAQQAAVIGRIFWDRALAALAAAAPAELPTLQEREFIFHRSESAFAQTDEYIFKHALLRDVTYETVLKGQRGEYHRRAAAWLIDAAAANDRSDEFAALIGEHFELGGDQTGAAAWYGRAGRQAAATYAHQEAIHYLSRALSLTPETDQTSHFALLKARERTYGALGKREEQRQDLERLVSLAAQFDKGEQAGIVLRQSGFASNVSEFGQAIEYVRTAIDLAQQAGDLQLVVAGHKQWGDCLYHLARYEEAREQYRTCLNLAQNVADPKIRTYIMNGLGNVANDLGDFAAARRWYDQAMVIAREIGDRWGEATCLNNLGTIANYQTDYGAARAIYEASLAIMVETGDRFGEGVLRGNLGLNASNMGNYDAATAYHQESLKIRREIADRYGQAGSLSNLGGTLYLQGKLADAKTTLENALAIQREIGDRWGEGISLNELGAVHLAQADLAAAAQNYQEALAIHQESNQAHYLAEDWAGLSQVRLAQGDRQPAGDLARRVAAYLDKNPRLDGAEDPMRAFHFTWETLTALAHQAEADRVLSAAAAIIQAFLDANRAPAVRETYLRQPHHMIMWAAWQNRGRQQAAANG